MKHGPGFISQIVLLQLLLAGQAVVADSQGVQLGNEKLKVAVSGAGKLLSVSNSAAGEKYAFSSDQFELDTDLGVFSNRSVKPTGVKRDKGRVVYRFDFF